MVRLFEPQLLRCLGPKRLQRLLNGSVAPRRMGGLSDLVTDCQFVLNDPNGGASTSQPTHVDNPKAIYAGLLYVRSPLDHGAGNLPHSCTSHCTPFPTGTTASCCSSTRWATCTASTFAKIQRYIKLIGQFAGRERM